MIILLLWSWWPQRDVFCMQQAAQVGGRATSAQAQALCRDAPPKLWIVARAHALLHCSTLLVAHIKSEFAKCTLAEVLQTTGCCKLQQLQLAPTEGRTPPTFAYVWTLHRKLQQPCIRTCSPATALPCLAQWGSRQTKRSLPCTGVPYAACGGRRSAIPCLRRPSRHRQRRR